MAYIKRIKKYNIMQTIRAMEKEGFDPKAIYDYCREVYPDISFEREYIFYRQIKDAWVVKEQTPYNLPPYHY